MQKHVMHSLHKLDVKVGEEGSTVRRGPKWMTIAAKGDEVILCVCSEKCQIPVICSDPNMNPCDTCDRQGLGIIRNLWLGQFSEIPARLIENEHEFKARTYSGLLESMQKAYLEFVDFENVTVLTYERVS